MCSRYMIIIIITKCQPARRYSGCWWWLLLKGRAATVLPGGWWPCWWRFCWWCWWWFRSQSWLLVMRSKKRCRIIGHDGGDDDDDDDFGRLWKIVLLLSGRNWICQFAPKMSPSNFRPQLFHLLFCLLHLFSCSFYKRPSSSSSAGFFPFTKSCIFVVTIFVNNICQGQRYEEIYIRKFWEIGFGVTFPLHTPTIYHSTPIKVWVNFHKDVPLISFVPFVIHFKLNEKIADNKFLLTFRPGFLFCGITQDTLTWENSESKSF